MPTEHVELARAGYAAFGRADFAWMIEHCTADVVIVQPPERPSATTYRGRNEFRAAFTDWPSQWDDFALDLVEVVELNDRQVLGWCKQRMRAGALELMQDRFDVFTFSGGKLSALQLFHTREQALAAAEPG